MNLFTDIALYLALALSMASLTWVVILNKKIGKFMTGKDAKSLEDIITNTIEREEKLESGVVKLNDYLAKVNKRMSEKVRKTKVVKFDAFGDASGNQSFAVAFLDENGDGVLLSSLYTRDRFAVYAKQIENYKSGQELSAEEVKAIDKIRMKEEEI